jgi:ankyrin repeat protein
MQEKKELLFKAMQESVWDVEKIEQLLDDGVDINSKDDNGNTIFHFACAQAKPHMRLIHKLIENKCNIFAVSDKGNNALHFACESNRDLELITFLLNQKSIDLNAKNNYGWTCLHYACAHKKPNIALIELLIKEGADIKAVTNNGITPVGLACLKNQSPELIAVFLNQGLLSLATDTADSNALMLACYASNPSLEVITFLLNQEGIDINVKDKDAWTCLHYACNKENPNVAVIELLLKKGADVKAVTNIGITLLGLASSKNQGPELIALLLKKGLSPYATDNLGRNALMFACCASNPSMEVITFLLNQKSIDVNARDNEGWTCLHYACAQKNPNIVLIELLLKEGADIKVVTDDDNTILGLACQNNQSSELIKELFTKGFLPNATNKEGKNALMLACSASDPSLEVITFLLKQKRMDVNAKNNQDYNCLFYVGLSKSNVTLTKLLLENKADPNAVTKKVPLLIHALMHSKFYFAQSLIKFGAKIDSIANYKQKLVNEILKSQNAHMALLFFVLVNDFSGIEIDAENTSTALHGIFSTIKKTKMTPKELCGLFHNEVAHIVKTPQIEGDIILSNLPCSEKEKMMIPFMASRRLFGPLRKDNLPKYIRKIITIESSSTRNLVVNCLPYLKDALAIKGVVDTLWEKLQLILQEQLLCEKDENTENTSFCLLC